MISVLLQTGRRGVAKVSKQAVHCTWNEVVLTLRDCVGNRIIVVESLRVVKSEEMADGLFICCCGLQVLILTKCLNRGMVPKRGSELPCEYALHSIGSRGRPVARGSLPEALPLIVSALGS